MKLYMNQLLSKPNMKSFFSWLNEWKVAVILVINSLVFFCLFYYDMNKPTEFGNREIIGDINFKHNTVKRKFEHNVVWNELDLNSIISFRDSILTEDNSNAILRLKDGIEIHLEPESMIILDISDTNKRIEFSNGAMNIIKNSNSKDSNDNLTVETGNGNIQFKNADVTFSKSGNENLNVGVARGDVKASIGGEDFDLKANESLDFNGNSPSVSKKTIKINNPVQSARLREQEVQKKFFNKMDAIAQKETEAESLNAETNGNPSIPANSKQQDSNSNLNTIQNSNVKSSQSNNINSIPANTLNSKQKSNNTQSSELNKPKKTIQVKKGKYDSLDGF